MKSFILGTSTKMKDLILGKSTKDENFHLGNLSKHYQPSSTTRRSTVICPLDTPEWMLYWDYNNLTTKVSSKNPHSF